MITNPLIISLSLFAVIALLIAGGDVSEAANENGRTAFDQYRDCVVKWSEIGDERTAQRLCFNVHGEIQLGVEPLPYFVTAEEPITNEAETGYVVRPTVHNEGEIVLFVNHVSGIYTDGAGSEVEMIFDCPFQVILPYERTTLLCPQWNYLEEENYSEYVQSPDWSFELQMNTVYYIELTDKDF